jgi:hypothetical protein
VCLLLPPSLQQLGLLFLSSGESDTEKCHHGFRAVLTLWDGVIKWRRRLIIVHLINSIFFLRDRQEA